MAPPSTASSAPVTYTASSDARNATAAETSPGSARRPSGVTVHHDFGRMDPPEELHLDRKGWRKGSHRLEAYWNGCVFVGDDIPLPGVPPAR